MNINLAATWAELFEAESQKDYYIQLTKRLDEEWNKGLDIYPEKTHLYRALEETPLNNIKVVILGQDPYHGIGQANGLCFSVNSGVKLPPSLRNIYLEIESEYGFKMNHANGDLSKWAKQGVLLLNCILTVRRSEPLSHKELGWEQFTNSMIQAISNQPMPKVFLLWGKYAQSKKSFIDNKKHLILEANHPSPLSAFRGFFKCNHFRLANQFLQEQNREEIDWLIQ